MVDVATFSYKNEWHMLLFCVNTSISQVIDKTTWLILWGTHALSQVLTILTNTMYFHIFSSNSYIFLWLPAVRPVSQLYCLRNKLLIELNDTACHTDCTDAVPTASKQKEITLHPFDHAHSDM